MTMRKSLTIGTALVGTITVAGALLMPASVYAQRPDGSPPPSSAPVSIVNPLPLPVVASSPFPVTIASLPSLTGTVTIANTPLPVTGSLDINTLPPITGSVSLVADTSVIVSNVKENPLFVQPVQGAPILPFHSDNEETFPELSEYHIIDLADVPDDTSLFVMEYVSVRVVTTTAAAKVEAVYVSYLGGPKAFLPCNSTSTAYYVCASPIKYYVPGGALVVTLVELSEPMSVQISGSVFGHLVRY